MMKQLPVRRLAAILLAVTLAASLSLTLSATGSSPQRAQKRQPPPPSKVDTLVAAMTLEEKVAMLHGASDAQSGGQAGYIPGVPRLGVPPLRLADGPAGIRTAQPATAMPAPVSMASTFSPDLAKQYGRIIGRDARARRQNVVLAPMVNIVRVPQGGRNFETLGEDPFLASQLAAAEIQGMQGEGVIATVKHFAFNNQENARMSVSAEVDEQTGREIELPAYEAAVRAGVGSVMCAYNKVNGTWAAESVPLMTDILRKDWGFKGFVMSDWGATHSAVPGLKAGMEMEMPSGRFYGTLVEAAKKGEIGEAVINEAVRRILTSMEAAGLLTIPPAAAPVPEIPATSAEARDIAVAGAVLLKNDGNILPLGKDALQSLAVIGPTAKVLLVGGGGSANVRPMRTGSPLEILRQRAGAGARVVYARGYDVDGEPVPAAVLSPAAAIDIVGAKALPPGSTYAWNGAITVPRTGDYVMKIQTVGGRGSLSFTAPPTTGFGAAGQRGAAAGPAGPPVPGRAAQAGPPPGGTPGAAPGGAMAGAAPGLAGPDTIPGFGASALLPTSDGLTNTSVPTRLEAGVAKPLVVTVSGGRGAMPVQVRLAWMSPEIQKARIDEAVAAAKAAKIAVVFAYDEGTEGRDRSSLSLPGYQDELIEAVAAANPRTVVVLNNGAPVLMPWAGTVAAILQMWYPGQEGAEATAAVLVGDAAPGGRLPVTFPKRAEDAPTFPPERYPGVDGKGAYSEGIYVGYRWYDKQNIEPLFPFGYGLSYTTFAYSKMSVRPAGDGYDVAFTLKNTGTREGVEVPQVYVGPPANAPVPMAMKKLAGFERVTLAPGQVRKVTVHVGARELSYWSTASHAWTVAPGRRTFMVGASSRAITLQAQVAVRARR